MSRRSTALREWPVPGVRGAWVRVNAPAKGKRSYRVTFPHPDTGKSTERNRTTLDAAVELAEAKVLELARTVSGPSLGHRPVRDLVEYFMNEWRIHMGWEPGTHQERARAVRWLPDWFLQLPVQDWRTAHSDRVLAGVAAAGHPLGSGEYWRAGSALSGLVTAGQRGDYLAVTADRPSPMRHVVYRKSDTKQAKRGQIRGSLAEAPEKYLHVRPVRADEIPGHDDVERLAVTAGVLCGWRWEVHVRLLAYTGLREGESLRLTVGDVTLDPDAPFIDVWRQLVEIGKAYSPTGQTLLTEQAPKGGRRRNAWLAPHLLRDVQRLIDDAAARPGEAPLADRLLLPGPDGGFMRPNNWRARIFNPAADALEWPKVPKGAPDRRTGSPKLYRVWPPHSLRHHAATWMLKDLGLPSPLVADYLGHVDSAFTERMYMDRSRTDATKANTAYEKWRAEQAATEAGQRAQAVWAI